MMTFISCAKTMTARSKTPYPETSTPHFLKEARENALYMTQFTAEELAQMLKVNPKLAAENYLRYHEFLSPESPALPALLPTQASCSSASIRLTYRRRFPVCPATFVDYLFLIRIAPPAGQYSELPLGRQCTIAGTRTENHV